MREERGGEKERKGRDSIEGKGGGKGRERGGEGRGGGRTREGEVKRRKLIPFHRHYC